MICRINKKLALVFKLTIIFCTTCYFAAKSQNGISYFESITAKEGLADLNVNAIVQDAQGFIWIGSEDGLTRYDGYNCIVYRHKSNDPHSLSDNEVYALCTDGDGTLWIGTANGLNRYDPAFDHFENFFHSVADNNSLAGNNIFALAKDHEGKLWIGTYGGGLDRAEKINKGSGENKNSYRFLHYKHNDLDSTSISGNQVISLCVDKNDRVWAGISNGLNILDKATGKFSHLYHSPSDDNTISQNTVYEIFADNDGAIWLCSKGMLDKITWLDKAGKETIIVSHILPAFAGKKLNEWSISDFVIDNNGNAWLATNDQGLIRFKIKHQAEINSFEQFTVDNQSGFANSTISKFYIDRSGILWIGTGKGVVKFIPSKNRFSEINLPGNVFRPTRHVIMSLLTDKQNRLWMGYDSDTVIIVNNDNTKSDFLPLKYHVSPISGFDQVNVMYQSRAGDIYIGTFLQGLFIIPHSSKNIYDKDTWLHISAGLPDGLPSRNIYALSEDKQGIIWIGTYAGLCSYDPGTRNLKRIYASSDSIILSAYIIRALCADEHNTIWCGTDDGLLLIKNGNVFKRFKNIERDTTSLSNNRVTVILKDNNNQMWIGTKQGLNLYNNAKNNFKTLHNTKWLAQRWH
jgi:ligand-binding sensor domain-containing protein